MSFMKHTIVDLLDCVSFKVSVILCFYLFIFVLLHVYVEFPAIKFYCFKLLIDILQTLRGM